MTNTMVTAFLLQETSTHKQIRKIFEEGGRIVVVCADLGDGEFEYMVYLHVSLVSQFLDGLGFLNVSVFMTQTLCFTLVTGEFEKIENALKSLGVQIVDKRSEK